MAPGLVRVALRRTLRDIKYVEAVRPRRAAGLVKDVYRQAERDFGILAPPIALHSPSPEVLAAAWLMLRESLVAGGAATRADKEVVATAVSQVNECPYCVEVHGMTLDSLGEGGTAAALGSGDLQAISDTETRALARWAAGAGRLPAEVPPGTAAELAAVAAAFHYLNRMVNVFLNESPLPGAVPENARAKARSVLGHFLRPGTPPAAGDSVGLLPATAADAPAWSTPGSTTADAFARAGAAVEAAGQRVLPPRVRDLIGRELKAWDGRPPGLGRSWTGPLLTELPPAERPVARLALLVALAAYQVDGDVVAEARRDLAGDAELVEAVAWASLAAATELGTRLPLGKRGAGEDRRPVDRR